VHGEDNNLDGSVMVHEGAGVNNAGCECVQTLKERKVPQNTSRSWRLGVVGNKPEFTCYWEHRL
jgi:hypothetical protein